MNAIEKLTIFSFAIGLVWWPGLAIGMGLIILQGIFHVFNSHDI